MLVTFNARNEHDRCKFAEDLREAISEMDEMDTLRIEAELEKQKSARGGQRSSGNAENRDSGVADVEVCSYQSNSPPGPGGDPNAMHNHHMHHHHHHHHPADTQLKRSALSNSLLDMHEQCKCEQSEICFCGDGFYLFYMNLRATEK